MHIERADLDSDAFIALMEEHRDAMRAASPLESQHALDMAGLRKPGIRVWTLRDGNDLLGCGALQALDARHAEIKAMRTSRQHLRRGVARMILAHLLDQARSAGHTRVSLETGATDWFEPARRLYASSGFVECAPFAGYTEDPASTYMTRAL